MQIGAERRLDRSDRHVRKSRLRLSDRGARPRVEFALSEALRLVSLPGEDQGRVYYFRRVTLAGVPADGNRAIWLRMLQRALTEAAQGATHGAERRSAASDAVYFNSHEEALEALLGRTLRREAISEWFWPLVSGCDAGASRGELVVTLIERTRGLPGSWSRVAQVVLDSSYAEAAAEVVAALPVARAAAWLRELGPDGAAEAPVAAVALHDAAARAMASCVRRFGREDPRTLWLASLAVLQVLPGSLAGGSVVARARATLRRIESAPALDATTAARPRRNDVLRSPIEFDEASAESPVETLSPPPAEIPGALIPDERSLGPDERTFSADERIFVEEKRRDLVSRAAPADFFESVTEDDSIENAAPSNVLLPQAVRDDPDKQAEIRSRLGEPSAAAGLYFMLNALAFAGFAEAAAVDSRLVDGRLAARILVRLAEHCKVDASDPILTWLSAEIARSNELFADLFTGAEERVVRAWALTARRWCWRVARLTARDVISREGLVETTRVDVDVSFPLEAADVRLRRIGLDIDPGWLPWLGCVVRFHYVGDRDRAR